MGKQDWCQNPADCNTGSRAKMKQPNLPWESGLFLCDQLA